MPRSPFNSAILGFAGETFDTNLATAMVNDPASVLPPAEVDRLGTLVAHLQRQLRLRKLAVFVRDYEEDGIVSQLPLHARVDLSLSSIDPVEGHATVLEAISVPLGLLATDHTGYASFDLRRTMELDTLLLLASKVGKEAPVEQLRLDAKYWILPFGADLFGVDAMANGEVGPDFLVLRYHIEQRWLAGRTSDLPLPSLQSPDITDWRLSPGSFALAHSQLVGENGCENFYPSDLSAQEFHFHQAIRRINAVKRLDNRVVKSIRYGYLLEYRTQWFPIGHSLGQVKYSLPLAAGEQVNLAIIDWSRTDTAARSEVTSLEDTLNHDQQRDRTVSEVVRATVREHQSGSSMMGGLGVSLLAPVGPAFLGGSLGLGAASTSSSGTRRISVDTTQQLSDGFHQASTALRELRSTVITQASQVESGRFETRTVTNYNHCHTLTILYYEVLRHYRTVTSLVRRRPILFVDLSPTPLARFADSIILANRLALENALLDPRLLNGFQALERKRAAELALEDARLRFEQTQQPTTAGALEFTSLIAFFVTGDNGTDGRVFLELRLKDGRPVRCKQIVPPRDDDEFSLDSERDDFQRNTTDSYVVEPETTVRWNDLRGVVVRHERKADDDTWRLEALRLVGLTGQNDAALLVDAGVNVTLFDGESPELAVRPPSTAGVPLAPPQLTDFISSADLARADALVQHLTAYGMYYNAALLIGDDPVARGENFRAIDVAANISLFDVVENRVVAAAGRELAFLLSDAGDQVVRSELGLFDADEPALDLIAAEDLISLPTRGVFAEGKLGYCSTCEVIDQSRFWDFQTSPIPGQAPTIAPVETSSRFQRPEGLTPTAFPGSLVNIVNPPAAPDPIAVGAALQVLGSGNLFRDMSGSTGLAGFLTAVAQGATSSVTALAGSRRESELINQIKDIPDLTPQQKSALIGQVLGAGASGSGSGTATGGTATTGGQPATPSAPSPTIDPSGGPVPVPTPGQNPSLPGLSRPSGSQPRPAKPTRPNPPPPPEKVHINVSVDLLGKTNAIDIRGTMFLTPQGGSKDKQLMTIGPLSLRQLNSTLSAELPYPGTVGFHMKVVLEVEWAMKLDAFDQLQFALNEVLAHPDRPAPTRFPTVVPFRTTLESKELNFELANGQRIALFNIHSKVNQIKVKTKTFAEVKATIETQLKVNVEIVNISIGSKLEGTLSTEEEKEFVVDYVTDQLELVHVTK
ncbi:MAG: hypothetical protein U0X20_08000 [Caldilineaceae bacterium]